VITFVIFPLALLLTILPKHASVLFQSIVKYCMSLIEHTALLGMEGNTLYALSILVVALLITLISWAPFTKSSLKWVLALLGVALLSLVVPWNQSPSVREGEIRIRFFDVGHGLSALIQVEDKRYLYDTGGRIGRVDSIYSRKLSGLIPSLDGLIVSHSDIDHAVGTKDVVEQFPNVSVYAGQPSELDVLASNCHDSELPSSFLEFIPIPKSLQTSDNNSSCVLVINNGAYSVVLTGDSSRELEYYLIQNYPNLLPFDLIVLGHHGSDTSSALAWLEKNENAQIINSGSDMARGHWPSKRILNWINQHAKVLQNTARRGTLDIFIDQEGIRIKSYESAFRKRLIY
jgi:competence protein ComEC